MKRRIKTIILDILVVCLLSNLGCNYKVINYGLSKEVTQFTTDSFDIAKAIGSEYKIIRCRVKNGKLLISALRDNQKSYFIIIDLRSRIIEHLIPDPFNNYIASSFDISKDSLFAVSALRPDTLFVTSLNTKKLNIFFLDFKQAISPGQIIFSKDHLFLFNDVYGIAVLNLDDLSKTVFHNDGSLGMIHPQSSRDCNLNCVKG